jgi:hypothetical protein
VTSKFSIPDPESQTSSIRSARLMQSFFPLVSSVWLRRPLCGFYLRQPHCSGDSAVGLAPFMWRDVHLADLQEGQTVWEQGGVCQWN